MRQSIRCAGCSKSTRAMRRPDSICCASSRCRPAGFRVIPPNQVFRISPGGANKSAAARVDSERADEGAQAVVGFELFLESLGLLIGGEFPHAHPIEAAFSWNGRRHKLRLKSHGAQALHMLLGAVEVGVRSHLQGEARRRVFLLLLLLLLLFRSLRGHFSFGYFFFFRSFCLLGCFGLRLRLGLCGLRAMRGRERNLRLLAKLIEKCEG